MNDFVSFSKTVIGQLHIQKNIPCEDASGFFSDGAGRYHIAVVADGHGDPACFRSKTGSQTAVEVALAALQDFAEAVLASQDSEQPMAELLTLTKPGRQLLKQLTDFIVSQWSSSVLADLESNPATEEELAAAGEKAEDYKAGNHLEHIYGTTLIAALLVCGRLILLQQGDGRCDVFFEDGAIAQPIPWDDRCFENVTTSMCDEDAAQSIRSCVIDTTLRPVIACYLGSDGVEDSYRTMEGTHVFYRELSCELVERPMPEFLGYLETMLPDFSRNGSGDDVSVAGIVSIEAMKPWVDTFRETARVYELNEELEQYQSRLVSMSRKHSILKRRLEETQREQDNCLTDIHSTEEKLAALAQRRAELQEKLTEAEAEWQKSCEDAGEVEACIDAMEDEPESFLSKLVNILEMGIDAIRAKINEFVNSKWLKVKPLKQALEENQEQLQLLREMRKRQEQLAETAKEKYDAAFQEFSQYDSLRQSVQAKCDRILAEIAEPSEQNGEDTVDE